MRAPSFWKEKSLVSTLLLPVAAIYAAVSNARARRAASIRLDIPVLCIGNVVAGGAGKTPAALAMAALLLKQGKRVHFLSRGYRGTQATPLRVDPSLHSAADVGDEPLLLAALCPTWVAKDRTSGAMAACAGADVIIMDDGFQNPSVFKDFSLLVIDGAYGLGNERVIPAGPLRETIRPAMGRASALLLMGDDAHGILRHVPECLPVLRAHLQPADGAPDLAGEAVVAFAGIARPRKFYRTLQGMKADIRQSVAYPDHHVYTARDEAYLLDLAARHQAILVTTAKDAVRLSHAFRDRVVTVPVVTVFEDEARLLQQLIATTFRTP